MASMSFPPSALPYFRTTCCTSFLVMLVSPLTAVGYERPAPGGALRGRGGLRGLFAYFLSQCRQVLVRDGSRDLAVRAELQRGGAGVIDLFVGRGGALEVPFVGARDLPVVR